jgi:acetyl-CoA synthetase
MLLERFLPKTEFASYEEFIRDFKINIPENFNFAFDVMDEMAKLHPDKTAMVWCDQKGAEATFTYSQIRTYSNKAANFFVSHGVRRGDPVMLVLKRRYEFWFCILALHKIGAICIPATHLLSTKDIAYRNNAADIKMIVTVPEPEVVKNMDEARAMSSSIEELAVIGGPREGWLDFDAEINAASGDFDRPTGEAATTNNDISLIYFTSGTTGMPKMVQHNFAYPLGHILTAKYWQNVMDGGLHCTVADTGWAKAAWGKIYAQWIAGSAQFVYDYERFDPKKMLEVITHYGVTSFCAPPTVFRFIIKEDLSKYDFRKLKYCTTAGEPLNPEVYSQFLKATGIRLMEGYGQTESVVMVATYPWVQPKPGSMGKPSPSYDIDLLDDQGNSCEVGVEGQIVVRTDRMKPYGMFGGYYREAERTTGVWHDNIYYTGDMAWRDEDGYFWFVGRADDLIKSSGYRIGPFEVESALLEHPAVLECAITGVPDEIRGQVVKATVVLAKGYAPSEELVKSLQEHVKKVTAPYKYPRIIEFQPSLPKTISGKIRRVEIREGDIQ